MAIDTAFKNPEVEDDSRGSLKEEAIASESASHDVSSKSYRNLVHRIDRRLIVTTGFMYCVSLVDRTNIGAANIAGMAADLGLNVGYRYSTIALVFFVSFIIFQPPATILCRHIGAKTFLPAITLAWGILLIGFGFPQNWQTLAALRFILGILEAGFLPCCLFLISTWYTRYDLQKRVTTFYAIGFCASGFGGILAYGLSQMEGLGNVRGWRWIFIMEGLVTIVVATISYFTILDFPDRAHVGSKFLTKAECEQIMQAIDTDRNDAAKEPWDFKKWISSGADLVVWSFALIFFGLTAITYAIAYFLPIILRNQMGFSLAASQCLIAPPYFVAAMWMYGTAWICDKYHIRGPVMIVNTIIGIIGLCLMGFVKNPGVAYFGVFLICCGFNTNIPACMTYQANNVRGQWKRAFSSATLIGTGGIGGIAGSLMFRSQDAPAYRPGMYASIGCAVLTLLVICVNTWWFRRENAKADRGEKVLGGHPDFRYTV
ncbi:putative phthalate transporter [Plectosphaerella cucumerina]|uniref:Phthalate transporter n=1 Tax=Plectosphaerella cucumerina TaxID=40658 RepID=A0A8K0X659_9PEZI|nr:putative phthalate transporter [Plectosphaerella cucumerina]